MSIACRAKALQRYNNFLNIQQYNKKLTNFYIRFLSINCKDCDTSVSSFCEYEYYNTGYKIRVISFDITIMINCGDYFDYFDDDFDDDFDINDFNYCYGYCYSYCYNSYDDYTN